MSTTSATTPLGVQGITEGDIANYLAASPGFFERHAELLGTIQLTSPHGQRAVSLQERQMEMLRDKIKGLERQIVEMVRHGQDNVAIAEKLHRWTHALMLTANAGFAAVEWLDEPAQALSIALIPLRHESLAGAFGLLVLASPDPTRYTADMGTDFLARIGEVASAALTRLLPAP